MTDIDRASDDIDRRLVMAMQAGLPLDPEPYRAVALQTGLSEDEVIARIRAMLEGGAIRRIGVVPNHYALGYVANGMSVWDIDDSVADEVGERLGALDFVTHCYRRPRHKPLWNYNIFAMVHGHSRQEVFDKVAEIEQLIGGEFPHALRASDIIFSTEILKKTGLRLRD